MAQAMTIRTGTYAEISKENATRGTTRGQWCVVCAPDGTTVKLKIFATRGEAVLASKFALGTAGAGDEEEGAPGAPNMLRHSAAAAAAVAWGGERGGDAVMTAIVELLRGTEWLEQCAQRTDGKARMWQLVASHLPGRTAADCQERWRLLSRTKAAEPHTLVSNPGTSRAPQTGGDGGAEQGGALVRRFDANGIEEID